jgi:quercetin dioxygenase-like cupin family protein
MQTIVSLLKDAEFKTDGLRDYFEYRDLGVSEATDGRFVARVIRGRPGAPEARAGWHAHYADFRMLYVIRGSVTFHYKDRGTFTLHAGDVIFQGHEPHYEIADQSGDGEVLEVASPASFKTSPWAAS